MTNIEQIKRYDEKLSNIGAEQRIKAIEYAQARKKHAEHKVVVDREIAKTIMKYSQTSGLKNMGAERAILIRLQQAEEEQDQSYIDAYHNMVFHEATYKGIERILEALQSQQMGIQSIMKWTVSSERFDRV